MRIRRALLDLILDVAVRDRLNHVTLSRCCGLSRQRATNLLRGKIHLFNSETLIDILAQLGTTVDIVVTRRQRYDIWRIPNPRPGWRRPRDFVAPIIPEAPGRP